MRPDMVGGRMCPVKPKAKGPSFFEPEVTHDGGPKGGHYRVGMTGSPNGGWVMRHEYSELARKLEAKSVSINKLYNEIGDLHDEIERLKGKADTYGRRGWMELGARVKYRVRGSNSTVYEIITVKKTVCVLKVVQTVDPGAYPLGKVIKSVPWHHLRQI